MSHLQPQELASVESELLCKLGFEKQTAIQQQAITMLASGKSILGLAPTGSGKTLAFLIPLMRRIQYKKNAIQLLILVPTRELGVQIAAVAVQVANKLQIEHNVSLLVRTAFGGQKSASQKSEMLKNPHVVIATPGRCIGFLEMEAICLDNLVAIVLDEADLMLGMGFETQIDIICSNIPKNIQVAMFSATPPNFKSNLQSTLLHNAITIDVRPENSNEGIVSEAEVSPAYLHQYLVVPTQADKDISLLKVLRQISDSVASGIVFCQTREGAHILCSFLREEGFSVEELSGELGQVERSTVLRRFKAGGIKYLVATNIASRGIDVKNLSIVINYDLPTTSDEYIHRVGRTGRAGKAGWALTFCTPSTEQKLAEFTNNLNVVIEKYRYGNAATKVNAEQNNEVASAPVGSFIKLHVNRGKTDKLRPGDILGAFSKDVGIVAADIGNIFIFDHFTHVEVNKVCAKKIIHGLFKIKNLKVKVIEAIGCDK